MVLTILQEIGETSKAVKTVTTTDQKKSGADPRGDPGKEKSTVDLRTRTRGTNDREGRLGDDIKKRKEGALHGRQEGRGEVTAGGARDMQLVGTCLEMEKTFRTGEEKRGMRSS